MVLSIFLTYLPYSLVSAYTPGPNTFLAFYSVGQRGWRKGLPVLLGMGGGFLCVSLLCGLLCYQLAVYVPAVAQVLKYVGACYILWLAIHVLRSKPAEQEGKTAGFWKSFALQFVNPKVLLYCVTIFTGYVLPVTDSLSALLLTGLFITLIGISGYLAWAAVGGLLQSVLIKYYKPFNLIMALILAYCAVTLVFPFRIF